jgi:hypothetical protein
MTTLVSTLGRVRDVAEHSRLADRLGSALNSVFECWADDPTLTCGDTDSSLVAIGRDLQTESRLLYRRGA